MDTFTWIPDYGAGKDDNPELTISKFGDGYAVRSPIEAFLKKQGGYKTFIWNPPDGSTHTLWVCEKWSKTLSNYGYSSLTAEFIQVFK
jgi:phage-related protein